MLERTCNEEATGRRRGDGRAWITALAGLLVAASSQAGPPDVADIDYLQSGDPARTADLFLPAGPGPHPVVVMLHGGTYTWGDKSHMHGLASALRDEGVAVITPNVSKLGSGPVWPDVVHEVRIAVQGLRVNPGYYGLDPDRIVLMGWEEGATLAMMAGLAGGQVDGGPTLEPPSSPYPGQSTDVSGIVSASGVLDGQAFVAEFGGEQEILDRTGTTVSAWDQVSWYPFSPASLLDVDDPPILSVAGRSMRRSAERSTMRRPASTSAGSGGSRSFPRSVPTWEERHRSRG